MPILQIDVGIQSLYNFVVQLGVDISVTFYSIVIIILTVGVYASAEVAYPGNVTVMAAVVLVPSAANPKHQAVVLMVDREYSTIKIVIHLFAAYEVALAAECRSEHSGTNKCIKIIHVPTSSIMDDDPNTASYLKMLPLGYDISGREEQFKTIFKHKKDYYRKYRDLSIFAFIGVYLISVVDA